MKKFPKATLEISIISKQVKMTIFSFKTISKNIISLISDFTLDYNFLANISVVFGKDKAALISSQEFLSALNTLPDIKILTSEALNGGLGAFSSEKREIYLSETILNDEPLLTRTLLEEIGHYLDDYFGGMDAKGDEGSLFASLVLGESLDDAQLTRLKQENDHSEIIVDGEVIAVEMANIPTDGNDSLVGTLGNDEIYGGKGNDILEGLGGIDRLDGGDGNDLILGGAGDDQFTWVGFHTGLFGGAGNDTIDGGEGNDDIDPGTGVDSIIGGEGVDSVIIDIADDTVDVQLIYASLVNGVTTGTLTGGNKGGTTLESVEKLTIKSGSGNDIINTLAATSSYIEGGDGDDNITGNQGSDEIYGGDGNDTLEGLGGTDRLDGGDGNDLILGGAGDDQFTWVGFHTGLYGGAGNDTIDGGEGNDDIDPGTGVDSIIGGEGVDSVIINIADDTVDVQLDYSDFYAGTLTGGNKGGTTLEEIEKLTIYSGTGHDTINTLAADSIYVEAGEGNDHIIATDGNDEVYGEIGNDTLEGKGGTDRLDGGDGNDLILGGAGDDQFTWVGFHTGLYGGAGNDTIDGGEGDDGIDPGTGADSIIGGAGNDWVKIEFSSDFVDVRLDYSDVNNGTITGGSSDGSTIEGIEKFTVDAGSGHDFIDISAAISNGNEISGGDGNDEIIGGVANDEIYGNSGNDTLKGGGGTDRLDGGSGNDLLIGGLGDDEATWVGFHTGLYGGTGNDTLIGVDPDSVKPGINEQDYLVGGTGRDYFVLGDENNIYYDDQNRSTYSVDYAEIADFNSGEDKVQLHGSPNDYRLEVVDSDTYLYKIEPRNSEDTAPAEFLPQSVAVGISPIVDEKIAVFKNVTTLDLTSNTNDFIFKLPSKDPTDISLNNNTVNENQPINTTVGHFSTTDADPGDSFTYSLVAGTGGTHNSLFTIEGNVLKTKTIFDYETQDTYTIRVQTTDSANNSYSEDFTVTVIDSFNEGLYLASNPDLMKAFGYNLEAATRHYIESGYFEGRQQNLFIPERYLEVYPDLQAVFGNNINAAIRHYIESGYSEGRDFLTGFDPGAYIASHADLLQAFGYNLEAGRQHYVSSGYYEGRTVTFEPDDYIASHADLLQAFGYNFQLATQHYINFGASENRVQDNFDEVAYLNKYSDLQNAFGNDLVAATRHYILAGYFEGRTDMVA